MLVYNGNLCNIEELSTLNDDALYQLMVENENDYKIYVSDEAIPLSYNDFQEKLKYWFNGGRNYQFLISDVKYNQIIGTIFFYLFNPQEFNINCSVFFIPRVRTSLIVAEAIIATCLSIQTQLKVNFINFSVYTENQKMHVIAKKIGAISIGTKTSLINPMRNVVLYSLPIQNLKEKFRNF